MFTINKTNDSVIDMIVPVDNVTASLVPDLILSTAFDQLLFALFPLEV